jgi:integrase
MPFKFELTWISHARKWRKRYLGQTYYLKTKVGGKTDRQGYLAALAEWERLKAFIDGLGPNPYTHTGALIPAGQFQAPAPAVEKLQPVGVAPQLVELGTDPPFIVSRGIAAALHPELIVRASEPVQSEEHRLSVLVDKYKAEKKREAERGNISLKQYDEDRRQVEVFRDFVSVNYPTLAFVNQISPGVLNSYRDKQNELSKSPLTLKKRLSGVRKFLLWLIDQNALQELPKDLTNYAKVKQRKPNPKFFTVDELTTILAKAKGTLRACILLGLNAGFTQQDCSTLAPAMIDWQTGILSRERNKTGVDQTAKLWPETLEALKAVGHFDKPTLLLSQSGKQLVTETVNPKNGKVVKVDCIAKAWKQLFATAFAGRSFKHLRKTSANYVEKWNSALTGLFLAHAERGTKRHYVQKHFEELQVLTEKLRETYKLS